MPLIPSKNRKAMPESDSKPRNLGMAYASSRKPKKKMADGGPVSASAEKRPMPDQTANDSKMASQNSSKKPLMHSDWTDNSTVAQAQSNNGRKVKPIKHPSMVPSDVFSTRLRTQEDDLMSSAPTGTMGEQPSNSYDEEDAKKHGPDVPALHMKRMAEGGKVREPIMKIKGKDTNYLNKALQGATKEHMERQILASPNKRRMLAEGGMINEDVSMHDAEEDNVDHPEGLESDNDQMRPSQEEYMASHFAKGGEVDEEMTSRPDNGWGAIVVKPGGGKPDVRFAEGGSVHDEEEMEHAASIAAAIMAKRRMLAEGGPIKSADSIYSDDSDQADLSRNADEDANMEDQSSFNALRKENYSETEGLNALDQPMDSNEHGHDLSDEDSHDMVSAIRRKMKKSPITR